MAKEYDDMSPAERKAVRNSEWDRLKSGKKKSKSKDKDKK